MVYTFSSKIWLWDGSGAWHFISLPKEVSVEIKEIFGQNRGGFGSIRVNATIGKTSWKTSIFPDKKTKTYLLPLKSEIRKKENLSLGDKPRVIIKLQTN